MNDSEFAEPLQQVDRVFIRGRGRKLLYFGGCDYHRLSSDPRIVSAMHEGLSRFGLTTAASRKTSGNHPLYAQLEHATAKYFSAESAVLVSSGYLANFAVAQALNGEVDHLLVDERCHSSLGEAARMTGARIRRFKHRDAADLARKLRGHTAQTRVAILTDGMFAFDGGLAPLHSYRSAVGPEPLLWVDDAHAAGVLGARGEGSWEPAGLSRQNLIQTVTFSKAFGVYGGAVLAEKAFRTRLIERSSAVSGNTPLPLPLAAAALVSLRTLDRRMLALLRAKIALFWDALSGGANAKESPIVPITVSKPAALSRALLAAGIYPTLIRYPGGPASGYFRFALSSAHSDEQIALLARVIRRALPEELDRSTD